MERRQNETKALAKDRLESPRVADAATAHVYGVFAPIYRVKQFWRGLRAQVTVDEWAHVQQVLPAKGYALFRRMPADAQRHSLDVYYMLLGAGYRRPDLLVASLLHDVGKLATEAGAISLGLWLRGPLVMAEWAVPRLLDRLAADDPACAWRYVIYVHRNHAGIGARWAHEVGCSELTCWLIAHHQDGSDVSHRASHGQAGIEDERYHLLRMLQWADGRG